MKRLVCVCIFALLPGACHAQRFGRALRYVARHKELMLSDAVIIAAWSADAASTVNDERNCPGCVETNPLLGAHPSEHAIWLTAATGAGIQTSIDHLLWHFAYDPLYRHMVWIQPVIIGSTEASNVYGNVKAAESRRTERPRGAVSMEVLSDRY